jgi:hypothetical protein
MVEGIVVVELKANRMHPPDSLVAGHYLSKTCGLSGRGFC